MDDIETVLGGISKMTELSQRVTTYGMLLLDI